MSLDVNAATKMTMSRVAAYTGDVYAPEFVGPVKFETFWRGDSTKRNEFLSSMAESKGVQHTQSFLGSLDDASYEIRATNHSYDSGGSPFISVSPNYTVAEYFARGESQSQNGWITKFQVPSGNEAKAFARYNEFSTFNTEINPSIGMTEQEYLVHGRIDPRYITKQFHVGP